MKFWLAVAFLDGDQLLDVVQAAERLGYHGVTVSDHIFYSAALQAEYPYTPDGKPFWQPDTPWPDPWVAIGAMAAVTRRLQFTTNIYVAPARDLFTVAKQVSTAAALSGGRVVLGAGPGWCEDEFVQTGQDFRTRGKRFDEMVPALRTLWQGGMQEFHGDYYDFGPLQISPVPPGPVPVYVGGDSDVALRRAARIGDGWIGNAYRKADAEVYLGKMRAQLEEHGRDPDAFDTMIGLYSRPDPELYQHVAGLGVTSLVCAPWIEALGRDGTALSAKIEALERFSEEIIAKV